MCGTSPPSTAAASAGQAGDDDAEERHDSVDDGLQSGGNGVDNSHNAIADRAENGLDLIYVSECTWTNTTGMYVRKKLRHPCLRLCNVCSISVVVDCCWLQMRWERKLLWCCSSSGLGFGVE